MRITDGVALWQDLQKAGLTERSIGELTLAEMERLADILDTHCEGHRPPYFSHGELIIPFGAPQACRWWQQDLSDKEKYRLLLRLGVTEEHLTRYMSQRSIDVAKGAGDSSGEEESHAAKI